MLTTHIYFNGQCKEAIELYKKAFNAEVKTIILNPEKDDIVIHAEIFIDNQLLYLNDFGNSDGYSISGGYQLCVNFKNKNDLMEAYSIIQNGSIIISPMQATDYSICVVRFIDRFDVRWAFVV